MAVLIVGGGKIGLEKLQSILSNAPATKISLVSIRICEEIRGLSHSFSNLHLFERAFLPEDLDIASIVMVAIDDYEESARIASLARAKGKLVNLADKPALCDFYMSSIVRKGNLKIAISTNGQSPTVAKRLRELLEEVLPEELDELVLNLKQIRDGIGGDFQAKVSKLNELTRVLAPSK